MRFDLGAVQIRKSTRLPHWDVQHGIYFVTFNLFDALPGHVRMRIEEEADAQVQHIKLTRGEISIAEKRAVEQHARRQIGRALDDGHGSAFMRDARVAAIVSEEIRYFDLRRYYLLVWSVMPNHVHVVFTLTPGERLERVIHSWKSFTAKAANKLLERRGEFWQEGYYDRSIRDPRQLARTVDYVIRNPANAGLSDWPFAAVYPDRIAALLSPGGSPGDGERVARPPR
jgi:REP element-mobilizing transposase RayT